MKWRSEFALALSVLGALTPATTILAQSSGPRVDEACACYAPPDTGTVPGGNGSGKNMLIFGAAGLAVISGLPFGGTSIQGLPFAAAPVPEMPSEVQLVEAPGSVAPADPTSIVPPAPAPVVTPVILPEPAEAAGIIPPNTATHMPLLAAIGLLMVGSGGLMARRGAREKRRKRRFVAM